MKKLLVSVLVLFVLCGATVFAQESDDSFVDTSDTPPIETYLGFTFGIDIWMPKDHDTETRNVPSVLLGARQYFMDLDGLQAGYSVFLSAGFISEMDMGDWKLKSSDADLMMNFGALVGGSLRGDIGGGGLGFVADLGFAFNMDMLRFNTPWYYYTATEMMRGVYDITNTSYGVGLNAALQYRMGMDASALIIEVGVNYSFCFVSQWSEEYYVEFDGNTPKVTFAKDTGKVEDMTIMRVSPYLAVGWKF